MMRGLLRLGLCALVVFALGEGTTVLAAARAPRTCCGASCRLPDRRCGVAPAAPAVLVSPAPSPASFALVSGAPLVAEGSGQTQPLAAPIEATLEAPPPGHFDRGPPRA